jgi:MoaA/NifB/PqqE/SkfB family radical SAM enzyme
MTNTLRLEVSQHGIDILNIYPPTLDNSFEKNALKESDREGLCPTDQCGIKDEEVAQKIMEAATKPSGEIWLDKEGKWMSVGSLVWPGLIDRILENTAKRSEAWLAENKPKEFRKWKLLQVESSISCNLKCIMCPWTGFRQEQKERGNMTQEIWEAIVPFLRDVQSVDFTGGGEPLLQKNLFDWIFQAKLAGCDAGFLTNGLLLKEEKCEKIINCGQDWLGISIDGATREMYEKIRLGSNFERICKNISFLSGLRIGKRPLLMVNFVIMKENAHQMEEIIRLAREIGADQVNFKQCDVVRGDYGKGFGLFDSKETQDIKKLEKALNRARRLGRKLNINTTAFSFFPEEQPVCDQDPRNSLFIRYDGQVSPCINLAIGGPSTFLGKDVLIPNIFYGKLPEKNIRELWDTELCVSYRKKFDTRVKIYNQVLAKSDIGNTLSKLQEAFDAAIKAMPEPPKGCEICHYLYDI